MHLMVGNVLPETYLPIQFAEKTNIREDAEYDSLVICFRPSGGWVGDTLLPKERVYDDYMYCCPIPEAEILKWSALIQNDGWSN